MAPPRIDKKIHQKDRLDLAIDEFAALEKPTISDLHKVGVIGQVQEGIEAYRAEGRKMSVKALESEEHCSRRLAAFLTAAGDPRPHKLCDAHAIISGRHASAAKLRAVLSWFARRIDDPINGCWLPRNTAAKAHMRGRLRNAVPHSRIHRKHYYQWLETLINIPLIKTNEMLVQTLKMIELKLQTSTFPQRVMLPAGREA
ncbi:AHH domain-containing protein [Microbulbifer rhizosphaerae]|uniref:Uncharacterized protein n=1 Tax=Microbulbifer rhizosphaerae TaxID=1562603 RepID=A0A7W4W9B7_9GAMM|nr:AHH domain-containing protein [Microbulbifer rhizosphaerae]MBB3060063.1 hypothetical protein [Microbulbifer rhizosphaerae]